MPRTIEAVLFDLDGTLYLPEELLAVALPRAVRAMREAGLRAPPPEAGEPDAALEKLLEIRSEDSNRGDHFAQLVRCYNPGADPAPPADPLIVAAGVDAYHNAKATIQPVEGAVGVLQEIQRVHGAMLGIVTNGIPVKQALKLYYLGITDFFVRYESGAATGSNLFVSDDPATMKPRHDLFRAAQERMGFLARNAVMVGDRIYQDLVPANQLGLLTVHVRQGKHGSHMPADALAEYQRRYPEMGFPEWRNVTPAYAISSLRELPEILRRIAPPGGR